MFAQLFFHREVKYHTKLGQLSSPLHSEFWIPNEHDVPTWSMHLFVANKIAQSLALSWSSPFAVARLASTTLLSPAAELTVVFLVLAMPKFSHFYSSTEADAHSNIRQYLLQRAVGAPRFSTDDAELLTNIIDGTTVFTCRPREVVNHRLFCPPTPEQPVADLLGTAGFSMSQEIIHQDEVIRHASPSERPTEWKTRSHTPSSDDVSPYNNPVFPPTLSVKVEALSSDSDSLDNDLTHL